MARPGVNEANIFRDGCNWHSKVEHMLTPTLKEGLEAYAIGEAVKALRTKKRLGLVELGRHTGLSPAMLSKIERGRLFPTLPTLLRIALVFGVGLDYFFPNPRNTPAASVVRRRNRLRFPERSEARDPAFYFESLDYAAVERRLNAYLAEFPAPAGHKLRLHEHPGGEFIYVLRGSLILHVADEELILDPEDSLYFDSTVPHGYRRHGSRTCSAIVVTTAGS